MDFPGQADLTQQKERLMVGGRDSAAYVAGAMQNPRLTRSQRAALRACRDQLENYIRVLALTDATNSKEIGALGYRMAEVLAECMGIISRRQERPPDYQ
jgi:hypothetical protein